MIRKSAALMKDNEEEIKVFLQKKNKMLKRGIILFCILALLALFVPLLSPWSCTDMNADIRNMSPNLQHFFGTDKFGRDLFVRTFYGARISLLVGILSALINGIFGICYGGFSGYSGKVVDILLMRVADIISSIPSLLYVILFTLVFGANEMSIILGLCISGWIETARIVRGEVIRLKNREFCIAAGLFGKGKLYIFFQHILPNAAGPVMINLTFLVPQAIFTEAFLSFMGVGISPPKASLGSLIQFSRSQMQTYPYQMIFPTLILVLFIVSMNLIGEGLKNMEKVREEE